MKTSFTTAITDVGNGGVNPRRLWRERALNAGAIGGIVCLLAAALSIFFGITPLVFRSGSMAPSIGTGSLAIAKAIPASSVRVGDVITVQTDRGESLTHRVVAVDNINGATVTVFLKGDANREPDPLPYQIAETKRIVASVPYVGYVVSWLSSGVSIFLGGMLAGFLMTLAFRPVKRIHKDNSPENTATPETSAAEEKINA